MSGAGQRQSRPCGAGGSASRLEATTEGDTARGLKIKGAEPVLLELVGLFPVFVTSRTTRIAPLYNGW